MADWVDRLAEAAKRLGWSQAELARRSGVEEHNIRKYFQRKVDHPRGDTFDKLAGTLGVSRLWLQEGVGSLREPRARYETEVRDPVAVPATATLPRDLEVRGVGVGGEDADFSFNGTITDRVRRPPGLAAAHEAFAIYVVGTSMEPRYEEGDLIYLHPGRPPRPGEDVVVELKSDDEHAGPAMLKRLVRRSPSYVELQQFNPKRDFKIPMTRVRDIIRVVRWSELMGV